MTEPQQDASPPPRARRFPITRRGLAIFFGSIIVTILAIMSMPAVTFVVMFALLGGTFAGAGVVVIRDSLARRREHAWPPRTLAAVVSGPFFAGAAVAVAMPLYDPLYAVETPLGPWLAAAGFAIGFAWLLSQITVFPLRGPAKPTEPTDPAP